MIRTCSKINQLVLWFRSAQFIWLVSLRLNRRFRFFPVIWQIVYVIVFLCKFPCFELTLISWRILLSRIIVGVEVLTLPVCAHKSTSFFKVSGEVNVLLFAKYFCFYSSACLRPLIQNLFCLLVSSFFLEFSILMLKPHGFKFLFNYVVRRIIVEVRGTTFKPVLSLKLNWLLSTWCLISSIECFKRFGPYCLFWLIERRNIRGTCHSFIISESSARHVERISNVSKHETCLLRLTRLK